MIFLGCLLAFAIAFAPRVVIILAWIFSSRWSMVWGGQFLVPLLGLIFLPFTLIMYTIAWQPVVGVQGWDWMWVGLGFLLDIMKWAQIYNNRKGVPGYPGGTDFRYASDVAYQADLPSTTTPAPPANP
jgi:hypothetical protein